MPEPIIRQLSAFLLFLLGGFALGFAYDLLRAIRFALKPRGFSAFILDLSYWLLALLIVFPLLIIGTWGEARLFTWLGLWLGLIYYLLLLSHFGRPLALGLTRLALALTGRSRRALRKEGMGKKWRPRRDY